MKISRQGKNVSIMIVGNSPFMRTRLRSILEPIGYKIIAEAEDGYEAIDKYTNLRPDVTLMEVAMPNKNGLMATREITKFDSYANVILCSNMDYGTLDMIALRVGAKDVIYKPYNGFKVNKAINKLWQLPI